MTRCNDNADKANRAQDEALKYIDELADARVELKELHSEAEMRNRTLVQNQNKIIKLKTKFSEVEKKLQDKEAELKLAEASALDFHDRMGHLHRKLTPKQFTGTLRLSGERMSMSPLLLCKNMLYLHKKAKITYLTSIEYIIVWCHMEDKVTKFILQKGISQF